MPFNINLGDWGSIFAVPSRVVDMDIKIAGVYQLKVLLYLLRHNGEELTYEKISEELQIELSDVKDSVVFWIDRGLLVQSGSEFMPVPVSEPEEKSSTEIADKPEPEKEREPEPLRLHSRPLTRPPRPTIQFVSQRLGENPSLSALMDEAQTSLQKPLSSGDICTLYMLFDTYGLPPEVILMLIEYSVSIEKASMHFIEKEGIRWSDEGVDGIEKAEEKIASLKSRYSAWGTVSAVFGLKSAGSPTKTQLAFADCWLNEWKFSHELLREAYERCVNSKSVCDFKYINGILNNWHKKGVTNLDELAFKDVPASRKNRGKPESNKNASYDIDALDSESFFDD